MRLRSVAPPWFNDDKDRQAKCVLFPATREHDPWYSDSEEDEDYSEDAKAICLGTYDNKPCPLLQSCLEFAMTNNERFGIWGGKTPDERAKLRKERKQWQQSQKAGAASSQES